MDLQPCANSLITQSADFSEIEGKDGEHPDLISFYAELPSSLQQAMLSFIEGHPCWDQYRLIQAALAGFLVQNGVDSRQITRLYVGNMFSNEKFTKGLEDHQAE